MCAVLVCRVAMCPCAVLLCWCDVRCVLCWAPQHTSHYTAHTNISHQHSTHHKTENKYSRKIKPEIVTERDTVPRATDVAKTDFKVNTSAVNVAETDF